MRVEVKCAVERKLVVIEYDSVEDEASLSKGGINAVVMLPLDVARKVAAAIVEACDTAERRIVIPEVPPWRPSK